MKAKFLKLAGVKDEKEFYKKFPTEEAFMAKYGKKLKKAVTGWEGLIKPIGMPKVEMANLAKAEGFGLSELQNVDLQQKGGFDIGSALNPIAGVASSIMGGISKINQRSKDIAEYQKYGKVSDVVAQAAASRPERVKKKYVRPEDNLVTNVNPLGTGTNYLAAENGAEIQNTYAPNVMYTDLGYEPLEDSNPKQYKKGGKMKKGKDGLGIGGFSGVLGGLGSMAGSKAFGGTGEIGGYGEIAQGISQGIGAIPGIGTVLKEVAAPILGFIAGGLDAPGQKQLKQAKDYVQQNTDNAFISTNVGNVHNAYSGNMEDGGWVSNDWQPQVIASFGEHSMKQLLKPDPMMNTLRAGGHLKYYTPPSEEAMYTGKAEYGGQYAMGGDLQVHRGEAEPISTNPYMPNGGETVMFRGPSHDDGGMPISYGNNGVEVEGGEPAQVMKDGGEAESLVVFGNMYIPDYGANEIGDPKAKGMKFKRYIADLSKQEAKQNKITDKATSLVDDSNTNDPFELLAFNSGKAMLTGSQMKLKDIANKKMNTAAVQNAILETAEEHGLDSAELSKTKLAKFGGKLTSAPIADDGINISPYAPQPFQTFDFLQGMRPPAKEFIQPPFVPGYSPIAEEVRVTSSNPKSSTSLTANNDDNETSKVKKTINWQDPLMMAASIASPFLRPRVQNELDPSQLAPEMMAMSMNQLEPVQAQTYQPIVTGQPTSFSLQDQLNEITAQTRQAERLSQGNPEVLANLAAQAYQAKSKVLADQFRMNQAEKQRVAEQNMSVLNDAQLKNLQILDQQYARQSEAKSKTKSQSIEIAKSISDKIAKNKLENRQLRVAENMYPAFNFTADGTAYKNPFALASFNTAGTTGSRGTSSTGAINVGGASLMPTDYDEHGTPTKYKKVGTDTGKNGKIVKAFKNF